jgi:hypothetical protein
MENLVKELFDAIFTVWGWWLTFAMVMMVLVALFVICGYGVLFLYVVKLLGG